ncbi:MAG: hypothetical protein ACFFDP_12390 [Promethearchaeota archaeon]
MTEEPTEDQVGSISEQAESIDCQELQDQVTKLTAQIKRLQSKLREEKDGVTKLTAQVAKEEKQVTKLTAQIERKEKQVEKLTVQLAKAKEQIQSKTKKARELSSIKTELENQLAKEKEQHKQVEENAKAKEEHYQTQIQALFKQIDKLRAVLKERNSEIQQLQEEILAKNDAEVKVQPKPIQTVATTQDTGIQDTTVLRRRVNDLEMELQHLKQALEKDPKYRIYLLVRETGQRTLEELSKVLGVGIFEARRRVQELVRGGLLKIKDEKVHLARL